MFKAGRAMLLALAGMLLAAWPCAAVWLDTGTVGAAGWLVDGVRPVVSLMGASMSVDWLSNPYTSGTNFAFKVAPSGVPWVPNDNPSYVPAGPLTVIWYYGTKRIAKVKDFSELV